MTLILNQGLFLFSYDIIYISELVEVDKMNDKKALGFKSYKFIILELIAFILSVLMLLLFFQTYYTESKTEFTIILLGIIAFGLLIYVSYLLLKAIIRPKVIIEYDRKGIYLNYRKNKTVYLLYKNISNVYAEEISAKAHTYKFGFLHIHTFDEKYKIGIINDVKEVEEFIESKRSIDTDIF